MALKSMNCPLAAENDGQCDILVSIRGRSPKSTQFMTGTVIFSPKVYIFWTGKIDIMSSLCLTACARLFVSSDFFNLTSASIKRRYSPAALPESRWQA